MPILEDSISNHILEFIKSANARGYNTSGLLALKNTYMVNMYNKRKINNLPTDMVLCIFEYLCLDEMLTFIRTSTQYRKLYPDVWSIFQTRAFPLSIIPATDYKDIRRAVALHDYYSILRNNNILTDINYRRVNKEENHMEKMNTELEYLKPNHILYEIRYITHKNELNAGQDRNVAELLDDDTDVRLLRHLNLFLDVSKKNIYGVPYFTIKEDLDCRIYGLNPATNIECYNIKRKWITGEYNDLDEEGDFNDGHEQDPAFIYESNVYGMYIARHRIRPSYC
jgi:hypothetical protein